MGTPQIAPAPAPASEPPSRGMAWQAVILMPLMTAAITGGIGFAYSWLQNQREVREANIRIYAELMSRREESDSSLRKDMFKSVMDSFFLKDKESVEQQILQLELLSYNFHEALDLGPLFQHVYRRISQGTKDQEQLARLRKTAAEVIHKQTSVLEEAGAVQEMHVDLLKLKDTPGGFEVLDKTLTFRPDAAGQTARRFRVEVLGYDADRGELQMRLRVGHARNGPEGDEVDTNFGTGFFDFPMMDNSRLSGGHRCALMVNEVVTGDGLGDAKVTLAYFPGSRASLKDKPYYDEVIQDLLQTRQRVSELVK